MNLHLQNYLIQSHDFNMLQGCTNLLSNHISAISVKTDGFTIRTRNVNKASKALDMKASIGEWRMEKEEQDTILPSEEYTKKE